MIFPYKFAWDDIRHVQSFVNYIMLEVILKSHKHDKSNLLADVKIEKYRSLIQGVNKDLLLNPLSELYEICNHLGSKKRKMLKRAVLINNRIEGLCKGKYEPVRYKDLKTVFIDNDEEKAVPNLIRTFCNNLYNICLERVEFTKEYGTLKSHYDNIVGNQSRCPACGITQRLLTKHSKYRCAFDHYLPKGIYPFVSVNFFNLVPTCDICNGKYKTSKDTLFYRTRKKAFYPYSQEPYDIQVSVVLHSSEIQNLSPYDIEMQFSCTGRKDGVEYDYQEEVNNWRRIYGIDEQYKSFCCSVTCLPYLSIIADGNIDNIRSMMQMMENLKDYDSNFLKVAMLRGTMEKLGLKNTY